MDGSFRDVIEAKFKNTKQQDRSENPTAPPTVIHQNKTKQNTSVGSANRHNAS